MFEISTESLNRDILQEMVAKARKRRDFAESSTACSYSTIKRDILPNLKGYVLARKNGILSVEGVADCPLDHFLRNIDSIRDRVDACGISYAINQSGKVFDPEEERDLDLLVRYDEKDGWMIALSIGLLSAGSKDMAFRVALFRDLVCCANLSESVKICFKGGEIFLESEIVNNVDTVESGVVAKGTSTFQGRYWVSGGACRRKEDGSETRINFSTLGLYLSSYDDFLSASKRCTDYFFSLGSVVRTCFWLKDYAGDYDELRSYLGTKFICNNWRVTILGRPKYGLDDLDKMFEETDSLLLPLFVIKDRKVGEINVELYHSKGVPTLHFSTYTEDIDKADKVIRQIVAELSDGKAVINEEV